MTKSLGEQLREKLDGNSFAIPVRDLYFEPRFNDVKPIDSSRKKINIVIKGKSEMYATTKVLVSLGGRDNLVLDADSQLLNVLANARIAKIDREWDGGVKTVQYLKDKPTISIVSSEDILPLKADPDAKIKALEQMQEKLKAESEAIAKQINALNNN